MRYPRFYTVRQWKRFDIDKQMYLCRLYDVILTDYTTRKEKIIKILKKFNKKNLDKGIDTLIGAIDDFSKSMDDISRDLSRGAGGKRDTSFLEGGYKKDTRDYSFLTGKKSNNN